jgi:hypothetical protein
MPNHELLLLACSAGSACLYTGSTLVLHGLRLLPALTGNWCWMALPALPLLMLALHPCDTGMKWLWLGWFLLLYLCAGLDWQPAIINILTMKLVLL